MESTFTINIVDERSTQEYVTNWASGAIAGFSQESGLLLPELILDQITASIVGAVLGYSDHSGEQLAPPPSVKTARLVIHFTEPVTTVVDLAALSPAQWGFFVVQRKDGLPDIRHLLLDLYLYQE